jgi:hypothetical protein
MTETKKKDGEIGAAVIIAAGLAWALSKSGTGKLSIEASSSGHGTINPTGTIEVEKGQSLTFEFLPDEGYFIEDVLVDGVSVGLVESYTFENIDDSHSLFVSFGGQDSIWYFMAVNQVGILKGAGTAVWSLMVESLASFQKGTGTAVWSLMTGAALSILKNTQATAVWSLMAGPGSIMVKKYTEPVDLTFYLMATSSIGIKKYVVATTYYCPYCSYSTTSQTDLMTHIQAYHYTPPVTYTCPTCGAVFSTFAEREAHILAVHTAPPVAMFLVTFCDGSTVTVNQSGLTDLGRAAQAGIVCIRSMVQIS